MTITAEVQNQYFANEQELIRLEQSEQDYTTTTRRAGTPWTKEEHERFLEALERYPSGPWKVISAYVATRTTRQTMTHAQKYREKIARWKKNMQQRDQAANPPLSTGAIQVQVEQPAQQQPPRSSSSSQQQTDISDTDSNADIDWNGLLELLDGFEPLELDDDLMADF